MRYFEDARTGDPSWAAYKLLQCGAAPASWARRVVEDAESGDPCQAALNMAAEGLAPPEWAARAIHRQMARNPSKRAVLLVEHMLEDPGVKGRRLEAIVREAAGVVEDELRLRPADLYVWSNACRLVRAAGPRWERWLRALAREGYVPDPNTSAAPGPAARRAAR
mgnify:CR=1 FL=1